MNEVVICIKKVIVLIGETAVGKTTFCEYAKGRYDCSTYEIGDYVRTEYYSLPRSSNILEFANKCYKEKSLSRFVKRAIQDSNNETNCIILSGIRSVEELNCILNQHKHATFIRLICDKDKREQRYSKKMFDKSLFQERDSVESSWMQDLNKMKLGDFIIENNLSKNDFYDKIDEVLGKIGVCKK